VNAHQHSWCLSFSYSALVNKFKNKEQKMNENDGCVCVCVYAYIQTCIRLQSDFLSGRLNAYVSESFCKCVHILKLWRQKKDYYVDNDDDDDVVVIDFYVADERWWWQMKRQTVLNSPHQCQRVSNRIELSTASILRTISSGRQTDRQSQFVSRYIRMLSDYAKDESRDLFIGKERKTML
jgi:hypothetical protein